MHSSLSRAHIVSHLVTASLQFWDALPLRVVTFPGCFAKQGALTSFVALAVQLYTQIVAIILLYELWVQLNLSMSQHNLRLIEQSCKSNRFATYFTMPFKFSTPCLRYQKCHARTVVGRWSAPQ